MLGKFYTRVILFVFVVLSSTTHTAYCQETWQERLQQLFPTAIVETFDNLDDWTGTVHNGSDYNLSNMPTISGSGGKSSHWNLYVDYAGITPNDKWIKDFGSQYVWRGTGKSALLTNGIPLGYGAGHLGMYIGDGTPSSGYSEIYVFYMTKVQEPREYIISKDTYKWTLCADAACNANTYYLEATAGGNPKIDKPSGIKVNDVMLSRGGGVNVAYANKIPAIDLGTWCWSIAPGGTYTTIYVRLNGSNYDPNSTSNVMKNYISYFSMLNANEFEYTGAIKTLQISTGFRSPNQFGTIDEQAEVCSSPEQLQHGYGVNFSMMNWGNATTYGSKMVAVENTHTAVLSPTATGNVCSNKYVYAYTTSSRQMNDANFGASVLQNKWFGIEYRLKLGDPGVANGQLESWVYDDKGNVVGHQLRTDDMNLVRFADHKYNLLVWGGNRYGVQAGFNNDVADSSENRFYIDDVIVDSGRVGPKYFNYLFGSAPIPPGNIRVNAGQ